MGSKSRIAKDIVPIIQKCIDDNNIQTYIEPFVGGCNVIDKVKCQFRYGSDLNKYLIALFNHLQNGGTLLPEVSRELYSEIRANYKNGIYEDWYVGNIGFLASYNGRWFDGGYAGIVHTKSGVIRNYYDEAKRNIEMQTQKLKQAILEVKDYREVSLLNTSMIYCDPPYANTKRYANATKFDYNEFWNKIREWSKDNFVLVSELDSPDDFICVWEQQIKRTVDNTKRVTSIEKLFTYKNGKYTDYIKSKLQRCTQVIS